MSIIKTLLSLLDFGSPHPHFRITLAGSLRERQYCDGPLAVRHLAFLINQFSPIPSEVPLDLLGLCGRRECRVR